MKQFGENFQIHKEILSLKGVEEYTAAAIASFAYDLPHAVVDGTFTDSCSHILGFHPSIHRRQENFITS